MAKKTKKTLWCLHGFLGLPQDWIPLTKALQPTEAEKQVLTYDVEVETPDLWKNFEQHSPKDLREWAKKFVKEYSDLWKQGEHYLMGYSLGGRLAAHIAIEAPKAFKAVMLVSTHPGSEDPYELQNRLARDTKWADRFANDPWDEVMIDWNAQEVFRHSKAMPREEKDFFRHQLSLVMQVCSLSGQDVLLKKLYRLDELVLVVGAKDEKYVELAQKWQRYVTKCKLMTVPMAGHRVPWDEPKVFADVVKKFISGGFTYG